MADRHLEPALMGAKGLCVAQMPLAEMASAVPGILQGRGKGPLIFAQERPATDGMPHTGTVAVVAGQQARARGCAGGPDMEVRKAHALGMQPVKMGCLNDWVAMASQFSISLVISKNEDDVWSCGHGTLSSASVGSTFFSLNSTAR